MDKKMKNKTLCKCGNKATRKIIEGQYDPSADVTYVCEKCARVSALKTEICKPQKFDVADQANHR
jgi:hypothetical protein